MPSTEELNAFRAHLEQLGFSASNPRSHSAVRDFRDGTPAEECINRAAAHEASARGCWLDTAFEPWRLRHGLTREQALSVAFDDQAFDPKNPQNDRATIRSLSGWAGQQHAFAAVVRAEIAAAKQESPNRAVADASHYPPRAGEAVDLAGQLFDSEGFVHRLVSLSSREVVTAFPSGFHVIFDRASFQAAGHPDVTLRNTPLDEAERKVYRRGHSRLAGTSGCAGCVSSRLRNRRSRRPQGMKPQPVQPRLRG